MKERTKSYHKFLIESLRDPEEAAEYLNEALEEDDPKYFLKALRNVAEAYGGMTEISKRTHLDRANLYRMLSEKGNPELYSIFTLLNTLGIKLTAKAA
ncbi:MAG: putative addiction module antidote protein [Deltaproteobacteria bacterium]|nr:putative addiction module antidote protein [Deltaproteobacteria bacterium]